LFSFIWVAILFMGCTASVVDSNVEIPDRKWTYRNHIRVPFEIKDNKKAYNIYFKLRHTAEYRYANIFVLAHVKDGKNVLNQRFEFQLAKSDGEWLGSGSGNVFSYTLPMFENYRFPRNGKFEIEIEQNMRDNPLAEVSDAGVLIEEVK